MTTISIIVPCYNEQEVLPLFMEEIQKVAAAMHSDDSNAEDDLHFELLFVDDGSKDATLAIIKDLASGSLEPWLDVRYMSFSRNFGKESALLAGFSNAGGDYCCAMDADLQDPPSLLPEMYRIIKSEGGGCDNVAARRLDRNDGSLRSRLSTAFYSVFSKIAHLNLNDGSRDYRLMNRAMVDAIVSMGEYNRFTKGIYEWVGFKTICIGFDNVNRPAGKTKWRLIDLFRYSVEGITSFSTMPLLISSTLGIVFCIAALAMTVFLIIRAIMFGDPVPGWPSLMCAMVFIGGLQFLCIGIMGQYLAKTYLEVKGRPRYIIRETNL